MHKTTFSQQPYTTEFFQKENREEYAKGNKTIIPIHTWLLYFFSFSHVKKKKNNSSQNQRWINCFSDYNWCLAVILPLGSSSLSVKWPVFCSQHDRGGAAKHLERVAAVNNYHH